MPESIELFSEIAALRDQVDDIGRSVSALARQSGFAERVFEAMKIDPLLQDTFLLVDGKRTRTEIVESLKLKGSGQSTVYDKLESLANDWDLIRPTDKKKGSVVYVHTSLARDLKLARVLERKSKSASGSSTNKIA